MTSTVEESVESVKNKYSNVSLHRFFFCLLEGYSLDRRANSHELCRQRDNHLFSLKSSIQAKIYCDDEPRLDIHFLGFLKTLFGRRRNVHLHMLKNDLFDLAAI